MPMYDYQCEKCGHGFEHEHAMSFTGKVKCPACGSTRTVKVFHAAGVHFKGSGFYVTDSSNSRSAVTTPEHSGNGQANGKPKPAAKPAANSGEAKVAAGEGSKAGAGSSKDPSGAA